MSELLDLRPASMTKHHCNGMSHKDWDYLYGIAKWGKSAMEKYANCDILSRMDAAKALLKIFYNISITIKS